MPAIPAIFGYFVSESAVERADDGIHGGARLPLRRLLFMCPIRQHQIVSFTARDHAAQAVLYKPGPVVVSRVFINARAATEGRPYSCSQSRHIVGGRTMSNNCRGGPPWPPVRLIHNPDVGLSAWIDFKMICKLTTKPGDFHRLSRAEAAHVDAR